jgi:hypothetical protein
VGTTCRKFNKLTKDDTLWRSLVRIHYPDAFLCRVLKQTAHEESESSNMEQENHYTCTVPCWREIFETKTVLKHTGTGILRQEETVKIPEVGIVFFSVPLIANFFFLNPLILQSFQFANR